MKTTQSADPLWTTRWLALNSHLEQLRVWRDAVPLRVIADGRSGITELAERKVLEQFTNPPNWQETLRRKSLGALT